MNRWTVLFAAMLFSMIVAIGCSNGNGVGPVAPASSPDIPGSISGQSQTAHTSLLGYYEITLDPISQTMEVVADRTAEYTINVVPFLNGMPSSGVGLADVHMDSTDPAVLKVDVEFEWIHPFPTVNQYKVYDFMGVIITNGDSTMKYRGLKVGKQGSNTYMSNADGYTRWFNPSEFTTTQIFGWAPGGIQNLAGNAKLNPYKYYAKGLSPTEDFWGFITSSSNNDGVFQSGAGRLMQLEFPATPAGDGLTFAYAAVCCWEEQGGGPYTPYHRNEAIACEAVVTPNLWYQDNTNQGGSLIADINIFSWDEQPTLVKVESTVLAASHDTDPGVIGGDNYSTYHVEIPKDVTMTGTTGQEFWVVAESSTHNYINIAGVAAPPSSSKLAAFWRFPLFIADGPYNMYPEITCIEDDLVGGCDYDAFPGNGDTRQYFVTYTDTDGPGPYTETWYVTDDGVALNKATDAIAGDTIDWYADFGHDEWDLYVGVSDGVNEGIGGPYDICANSVDDVPAIEGDDIPPSSSTQTYDVQAYSDPDGDTLSWDWVLRDEASTVVTAGVTDNTDGSIEIDWVAAGASDGDLYTLDCTILDICEDVVCPTLDITITDCPAMLYVTSFASSEGEASNWSKSGGGYWACHWFDGAIADDAAGCGTYGSPNFYAWRTSGIPIPSCWSGNIILTLTHSCSKQETYYDRSGVQYSLNGSSWSSLQFYDHPYNQGSWWDGSWSARTSHAYLQTLVTPGNTIWIRFDSYSLDTCCNSATGWNITDMTIGP
ncbi:MAG: hypothetical protein NTY09_14415 [bacterium]|nr:hypothetical protein [bacterium]